MFHILYNGGEDGVSLHVIFLDQEKTSSCTDYGVRHFHTVFISLTGCGGRGRGGWLVIMELCNGHIKYCILSLL